MGDVATLEEVVPTPFRLDPFLPFGRTGLLVRWVGGSWLGMEEGLWTGLGG